MQWISYLKRQNNNSAELIFTICNHLPWRQDAYVSKEARILCKTIFQVLYCVPSSSIIIKSSGPSFRNPGATKVRSGSRELGWWTPTPAHVHKSSMRSETVTMQLKHLTYSQIKSPFFSSPRFHQHHHFLTKSLVISPVITKIFSICLRRNFINSINNYNNKRLWTVTDRLVCIVEWMLDEHSAWMLSIQTTKCYWQEGAKNIYFLKCCFWKTYFLMKWEKKRKTKV